MAALWEAVYRHTGWFVPKPAKEMAEDVFALKGLGFDTGLRKMRNKETGKIFWAHSDIDLQFIAQNGAPVVDVRTVEKIFGDVNNTFRKPILQHGDNFSGLTQWLPKGPTRVHQDTTTIFISQSGYIGQGSGIAGFLGFLTPAWRNAVETFLNMPEVP